jgi:hypothetical protein
MAQGAPAWYDLPVPDHDPYAPPAVPVRDEPATPGRRTALAMRVGATAFAGAIIIADQVTGQKLRMIAAELGPGLWDWWSFLWSPAGMVVQGLPLATPWLTLPFPGFDRAWGRAVLAFGVAVAAMTAVAVLLAPQLGILAGG